MLVSQTRIAMADPAALAARLAERLAESEIALETGGGGLVADLGRGRGYLSARAADLTVRVEAADAGDLEMLRTFFASHIVELAQGPLAIAWSGLDRAGTPFSNFREIRLVGIADLGPRLRRLTFAGSDLARFAGDAELHVRLYIPPKGCTRPEWPLQGPDGRTLWPSEERRPEPRYYTLRHVDAARGEVAIDFVMHAEPGPGADFAASARPGDLLGMVGPLGGTVKPASWYLLAGDETALPAIARILEALPRSARGEAVIEVGGPEDELRVDPPPGLRLRWLHRGGAAPGSVEALTRAVTQTPLPAGEDPFVWIGCELAVARALRHHFGTICGLPRDRHAILGYWSRQDRAPE